MICSDPMTAEPFTEREHMSESTTTQIWTKGFVTINGLGYHAQQKPAEGNFRKRSTRYFKDGVWSEWNKDDHDIFTPLAKS
jgi:hypothetical protein